MIEKKTIEEITNTYDGAETKGKEWVSIESLKNLKKFYEKNNLSVEGKNFLKSLKILLFMLNHGDDEE